jgi:hypothetical protein
VRASTRRNSAGVPARYLQLVHNVRDPAARTTPATVLHSFGRVARPRLELDVRPIGGATRCPRTVRT